jgi:filamentous hemagglutinin family protein
MKRIILLGTVLSWLVITASAEAAVFSVTPTSNSNCSDLNCNLQSALNAAATNGQDDIINLAAGTYSFPATITYKPTAASGENFSLTITGAGESTTILDGETNTQLLNFDTTLLAYGAQASMILKDLTITGSGDVRIATNSSVSLSSKIIACSVNVAGSEINLTSNSIFDASGATFGSVACARQINLSGSGIRNAGGSLSLGSGSSVLSGAILSAGNISLRNDFGLDSGILGGSLLIGRSILVESGGSISLTGGSSTVSGTTLIIPTQIQGSGNSIIDWQNFNVVSRDQVKFTQPIGSSVTINRILGTNPSQIFGTLVSDGKVLLINNNGSSVTGTVSAGALCRTATNQEVGVTVSGGTMTRLAPQDPNILADEPNKPADMIYGLFDVQVEVKNPGDSATVKILLPKQAPEGYKWFKYLKDKGWYDFSEHAVFSADRMEVTLTLTDGGIGDDDGIANGIIVDPSGLGKGNAPPVSSTSTSEGGRSGCFIATAAYGSILHPYVKTLRAFRDTFLLTNSLGKGFVDFYYRYSPPVADFIARHAALKYVVRICLLPLITLSWLALNLGMNALVLIVILPMILLSARLVFKKVLYSQRVVQIS